MLSSIKRLFARTPDTGSADNLYRLSCYMDELGDPDYRFPKTDRDDVDIFAFGRDFSPSEGADEGFVLLTSGMSDRRMTLEQDAGKDIKARAELMWYVRKPTTEIIANMRWLAKFPFIDDTWLGFGHTLPLPDPVLADSDFRTFLFLTPIVEPDERIAAALTIESDDVEILTVNLISDAECHLIRTGGLDRFLDILDEYDHPPILDPRRNSYV